MRDLSGNHDSMALNGATVRRQWRLDRILDECARRGIRAVSPWREQVAEIGLAKVAAQLRALDMRLSGYCRVGFFTGVDQLNVQVPAGVTGNVDLVLQVDGKTANTVKLFVH